jgi:hypothetical protein
VKHTPLAPFYRSWRRFIFYKEADLVFEKKYEDFWREQVRKADGQRMEMLQRDLTGTKKLLEILLLPVFGSFEGWCSSMRW